MTVSPGWYHNVIKPSVSTRPVIAVDLLPFRDELMATLQLSQTVMHGGGYALHKWMAHARGSVPPHPPAPGTDEPTAAHIVLKAQRIHPLWQGQIVLELEGTSEALHDLILRCAGPSIEEAETRRLLDVVLRPQSTALERVLPPLRLPMGVQPHALTFFQMIRERCLPGVVVLQPLTVPVTGPAGPA